MSRSANPKPASRKPRGTPKSAKVVGECLGMSYHRNGVSGRGFWTILFRGHDDADSLVKGNLFVATFFPKEEGDEEEDIPDVEACVAVLRLDDLNAGDAEQAWRGDHFHTELQALVKGYVWSFDRNERAEYDGAGRELTNRREAIRAQKAKKANAG